MTETMRAAVVHEFGRPLTIDRLPIPAPGPGQVLIRIDPIFDRLREATVEGRIVLDFAA